MWCIKGKLFSRILVNNIWRNFLKNFERIMILSVEIVEGDVYFDNLWIYWNLIVIWIILYFYYMLFDKFE